MATDFIAASPRRARGTTLAVGVVGVAGLAGLSLVLALLGVRGAAAVASEADRLAERLAVRPGSHVADVGAGDGAFTVELGRRVGADGRVFATEIDEARLRDITRAAERAGLANVTVVRATDRDPGLPAGCCDALLLRRVYHHLEHPEPALAGYHGALRPGGRLAIVDFPPRGHGGASDVPERGGHGIAADLVVSELVAAGFVLRERVDDWGGRDYFLLFEKR